MFASPTVDIFTSFFGLGDFMTVSSISDDEQGKALSISSRIEVSDIQHICETSGKNFFGYAYSLTSSSDSAKEIVQIVLAKIIARIKRDGHLDVENIEAYVVRAIRNEHLRRAEKQFKHAAYLELVKDDVPSAEVIHLHNENNDSLSLSIQKLPTAQRTCIVMYYYNDLSVEEISVELKISKSAVKTHIQRGRASLQKYLVDEQEDAI